MAFSAVFPRVLRPAFGPGLAAADASWWLSGGVSPANAIAVYQPKGAVSLAASYVNLANPGTYNAAPGVAPTLDADGWVFNGSTQYLTTGITPGSTWSMLVRFSDVTLVDCWLAGVNIGTNARFYIAPRYNNTRRVYGVGTSLVIDGNYDSGVMGIVNAQGYYNGATDGAPGTFANEPGGAIWLGRINPGASYGAAKIQAFSLYDTTLSGAQVAAITTAMNAL